MSEFTEQGGGSNLPIVTTRKLAVDEVLAWGDHNEIFGMHDFAPPTIWGDKPRGWIVHTALLGENPPFQLAFEHVRAGGGLIIRLNEDYGRTIPTDSSQWQRWADDAGRWLSQLSDSIKRNLPNAHAATYVCTIANEMNAVGEWGGVEITPERYAVFFNICYRTIKAVCPNVLVAPGAISWYGPTRYANGEYLSPRQWWLRMIAGIADLDAIAIHTYSHSNDPKTVTSDAKFGDWPLQDIHYDFGNYADQMSEIPEQWRFLPVYILESNAGANLSQTPAWKDEHSDWIAAAYNEIRRWNNETHNQQIHALVMFCWTNRHVGNQEYGINGKNRVIADFVAAQQIDGRRYTPNWLPPYANKSYESQNTVGSLKYKADCGHACIKMWLTWLRLALNVTIDQLTDLIRQNANGYSTGNDLVRLAGMFGITAQFIYDQSPESGDICLIDYSKIKQRFDKNFTGYHWLIYLGEKDHNAVVSDPDYYATGNTGRNLEYNHGDFTAALTGWVVRRTP